MANLLREEVYWADLNPVRGSEQSGVRPVLILSNNHFNRRSGTVIAMATTSQPPKAGFPLTLESPTGSLPRAPWVKISQVRTISVDRIGKRVGKVNAVELGQIVDGLTELIT
jgi:mRNA interferase MazF